MENFEGDSAGQFSIVLIRSKALGQARLSHVPLLCEGGFHFQSPGAQGEV